MIEITDQQIREAYAKASPEIIDVATAEKTAHYINELTDTYHVPKELKSVVAEEILFLLLKLVTETEVPERLNIRIGIEVNSAKSLVEHFVRWTEGRHTVAEVAPTTGEPRPLTREELMQKLTPRRTMVADVASVQHQKEAAPQAAPSRGYDEYTKNGGGV